MSNCAIIGLGNKKLLHITILMLGQGSTRSALSRNIVQNLLNTAFSQPQYFQRRLLLVLPQAAAVAALPLVFDSLYQAVASQATCLDVLVAVGKHEPPLTTDQIATLLGSESERPSDTFQTVYPKSQLFPYLWFGGNMVVINSLSATETASLTDGELYQPLPIELTRQMINYDELIICGPLTANTSDPTHSWLMELTAGMTGLDFNSLSLSRESLLRMLQHLTETVNAFRPITLVALVIDEPALHGLYIGDHTNTWRMAANLAAQLPPAPNR